MACDSIGTWESLPNGFVEFVLGQDPGGDCQNVKVGTTSPGPVLDDEMLARFVFSPTHTESTAEGPGAINETLALDAFTIGCSVNRIDAPSNGMSVALHEQGEAMAARLREGGPDRERQPNRRYLGMVRLVAGDARAVGVDEVTRRIRVYDTSQPNDSLHADIVANPNGLTKALKKQLRVKLFRLAVQSGLFVSPHLTDGYDVAKAGIAVHAP